MILLGAFRMRNIAMRADKSKNGIKRNKYSKVIASGKQVREFAIRRPTRRITQDTATGGMRTPCAKATSKVKLSSGASGFGFVRSTIKKQTPLVECLFFLW